MVIGRANRMAMTLSFISQLQSKAVNPLKSPASTSRANLLEKYLCLADYFASKESGKMDVVAFQVVTVGQEATDRFDRLQAGR